MELESDLVASIDELKTSTSSHITTSIYSEIWASGEQFRLTESSCFRVKL